MDTIMNIGPGHAGWLVWVVWALIGVFEAMLAQRLLGGKRMMAFDLTVGIVAAVVGGYLSICYIGLAPVQLFLVSVLSAAFFGGLVLWLCGTLLIHFSNKDE